jgi:ribosomal protein S18 acetylase RimI-like enzyme
VSRLLRALEADGLVRVEQRGEDGRERTAVLTAAGKRERRLLDQRAADLAEAILTPLSESQRGRLVAAMAEVQTLFVASMVEVAPRLPADPAARFCVRSYFRELGQRFEDGFDPTQSISATDPELTPPAGLMLVATLHAEPVGCGALRFHADAPAEIKRMWVAPTVRGLGLGGRLLDKLEAQARKAGARTVHLETNRSLTEAIAMYRRRGYREVERFNDEPYAHHWFEKDLV